MQGEVVPVTYTAPGAWLEPYRGEGRAREPCSLLCVNMVLGPPPLPACPQYRSLLGFSAWGRLLREELSPEKGRRWQQCPPPPPEIRHLLKSPLPGPLETRKTG